MDKPDLTKIGRLALREEGEWWNAYYALDGTMEEAVHLGSIRMSIVQTNPEHKIVFMGLMREIVADRLEEILGKRPSWEDPKPAPEAERGRNR